MKRFFFIVSFFVMSFAVSNLIAQPLSGTYYIPQGGNPQGFASLSAACAAISANGASGTVLFYIDGNLTESSNCLIQTATFTETNRLTIKAAPGKTPTVTFQGINAGNEFITISSSSYITIDGSNGTGNSRDMTFAFDNASGKWGIEVTDDSKFLTIKNLKVIPVNIFRTGQTSGITLDGSIAAVGFAPTNAFISNCQIGTDAVAWDDGVAIWGNDASSPAEATVVGCEVYARRRGITTFHIRNNIYDHNTINITDARADLGFYSAIYITGSVTGDTVKINGNKFNKMAINTSASKFAGAIVVYGNTGEIVVTNNFIGPEFSNTGTATDNRFYGVVFGSATWNGTITLANNSFKINAPGTGNAAAIGFNLNPNSTQTINAVNNIFIQDGSNANSYIVHYPMALGGNNLINFDWNTYYLSGIGSNFALLDAATIATLNDWKTASSQDANSNYKSVNFASATDLHLSGASVGDWDLRGTPLAYVTNDIDGDSRHALFPYKGADEGNIPLPVELSSFTANMNGNTVVLDWTTATETNNMGFDVEKSSDGVSFSKIGFVKGSGTTTSSKTYQFKDEQPNDGKTYYRLRQIDLNGQFAYSQVIEIETSTVTDFVIYQNYPNPFNPSTTIKFNLPAAAQVNITVFDVMGSEVANILTKDLAQGTHSVDFNASHLASGSYLYTITATMADGTVYRESKKMQLLK